MTWPHEEAEFEADGLRVWDGDGAIRLLNHDRDRWTLLLERCVPGQALGDHWTDDTVEMGCRFLNRLWRTVDDDAPFDTVTAICGRWAAVTRERLAHPPACRFGVRRLRPENPARRRWALARNVESALARNGVNRGWVADLALLASRG